MSESLLQIKHRDSGNLLHSVKDVRISTFYTPSSFYLQLLDEDAVYNKLKDEMLVYFNNITVRSFCCALGGQTLDNPALDKIKIQNLKVKYARFYYYL